MKPTYNTAGYTKEEYAAKLQTLSDRELRKEAEQYIWLSAYASNNPRSAYHWMCSATYDEALRRDKVKQIYTAAYRELYEQETGTDPYPEEEK